MRQPVLRVRWIGLVVAALALAALAAYRMAGPHQDSASAARQHDEGRPVPVVTAAAVQKDVPIYLDGIGTVQAYRTVTVRSRVDGELVSIGFQEGQDVHAGDVLARIDPRTYKAQLDQAAATRDKDSAQLDAARRDLARYVSLGNRVTGQSVDTQRALVRQLEATVRADAAQVDNARTMLSYTTITAPIDGRTGMRLVDEGNIVHASDSTGLVVLTQVQPIAVVFTLPQQDLPQITAQSITAQTGPLPVIAVQADGHTPIDRGRLELVDNQIDSTTGTVKLKAVMPNPDRKLWPGGFVNVRLLVTTVKDGLVVPAPAVQRGPRGTYAYVIGPDQTAEMREITVAQSEGGEALVTAGLKPGEKVVVDGAGKLQPGGKVTENGGGGAGRRPAQ